MARKRRHVSEAIRVSPDPEAFGQLLDAIVENPGDPAVWTVYGDLLQTAGHPRGELIALMIEREQRPSLRLYELQRRHLAQHAGTLASSLLPASCVVGWRRGFANELRLDKPEQLALVLRDPALRLVEAGQFVVDLRQLDAWRAALATTRLPWRRLRVDFTNLLEDAPYELAPLFACVPGVEIVRLGFPDPQPVLAWADVRAPQLRRLVLDAAGEVMPFAGADLPALVEL